MYKINFLICIKITTDKITFNTTNYATNISSHFKNKILEEVRWKISKYIRGKYSTQFVEPGKEEKSAEKSRAYQRGKSRERQKKKG